MKNLSASYRWIAALTFLALTFALVPSSHAAKTAKADDSASDTIKKRLIRSTVYIENELALASRDWESMPKEAQEQIGRRPTEPASGSGFLITDDGYIVTNAHVVGGIKFLIQWNGDAAQAKPVPETTPSIEFNTESPKDPFTLQFNSASLKVVVNSGEEDEKEYRPSVIKVDTKVDLALLKISDEEKFTHLDLSSRTDVESGMRVVMVGFPGGKAPDIAPFVEDGNEAALMKKSPRASMNFGSVSAIRENEKETRYQLSVGANHGNSGGPITDEYGKVIGVLYAGIDYMQNINYAIPTRYLSKVCGSDLRAKLKLESDSGSDTADSEEEKSGEGDQDFNDFLKSGDFKFGK